MSFLFPSFLWGLLGVSVPILIHLFNFRKTQKVEFTNVAFLRSVQVSTHSFRKLKNLLILLARTVFVSFLVFAFAQPFINRNHQDIQNSQGVSAIYLDNSLSMQNTSGNQRYLDVAVQQTDQLVSTLPQNTNFLFLTNNFENKEQFLIGKEKFKDLATELTFSNTFRPAEVINQRQLNLLKKYGKSSGNRFFWISDFQKSTSGDLSKLKLDSANKYFIIPVQTTETANIYVDSVWLDVPFIREGESNLLNVKLVNTGKEKVENKPLKLFIDDRQVSTSAISIDAKSQMITTFNFIIQDRGYKKGKIVFDDSPVTFDNEYFFVLNAAPVIQIIHLFGQPDHRFVENVFSNNSIFNTKSLNASATDPSVITKSDLVILDEVDNINVSLSAALKEYVLKGGSLVIFPSINSNPDSYTNLLTAFGVRGIQKSFSFSSGEKQNEISLPDVTNPFFSSIFENGTQKGVVNMPSSVPIFNWNKSGNVLLKYKNDQPFLSQFQSGKGKVYFNSSPLNLKYSDFAKHALFVPVMYKIASLSKSQENMAYSFGQHAVVTELDSVEKNQIFHLRKSNFDLIPQQQISGKQLIFELPQANQTSDNQVPDAGYYELTINGKAQKIIAFNYDKKESQTECYSSSELKNIFGKNKNVQIYESATEKDFINDFKDKNIGLNLWKYCVLIALGFLFIETLIIRFL